MLGKLARMELEISRCARDGSGVCQELKNSFFRETNLAIDYPSYFSYTWVEDPKAVYQFLHDKSGNKSALQFNYGHYWYRRK